MRRNQSEEFTDKNRQANPGLVITRTEHRRPVGGTWAEGTLWGYRFQALVFSEHSNYESYELDGSRISKLWVQRVTDGEVLFEWDRGLDVPASSAEVDEVVRFLCANVADLVFPKS